MHGTYIQALHRHIQDDRRKYDDGYWQILGKPDQFFVVNVQHTNSTPQCGVLYNYVVFTEHPTIKIFY